MRSRSGYYRGQDGTKRIWFAPADIESMMEGALRKSDSFPTQDNPTVDIERFIQCLQVRMDQYAQLDNDVLGLTEFYEDEPPKIFINRDLTGAIDDDLTPAGVRGRWRATMAHEASHVMMHRALFEANPQQQGLFPTEPERRPHQLPRCLKKNVLFRGSGTGDWREVQANMGMAALLMPHSLFRLLATEIAHEARLPADLLTSGSAAAARLSAAMGVLFDVSRQAAGIRLETLGFIAPARQAWFGQEAASE